MATIKDVANLAQVHPSTVSRVFSGHCKISAATRDRVFAAAEQLSFHPNAIARSLTTRCTLTLGMTIPYTRDEFFVDPFFPQVVHGLSDVACRTGFTLLLAGVDCPEDEPDAVLRLVRSRKVDGIIVQASRVGIATTAVLLQEHLPFVLLGRPPEDKPEISWVEVDARQATYDATRYLTGLGHQRIGFIGGPANMVVTLDRLQGYRQALLEWGLAYDARYVAHGDFTQEGGAAAISQFLALGRERPTAVFAANDLMAVGSLQALQGVRLSIPGDCSLIGSNDSMLAPYTNPPLTSSRVPYRELGQVAAEALLAQLDETPAQPVKRLLPCRLIVRASTAPAAAVRHTLSPEGPETSRYPRRDARKL